MANIGNDNAPTIEQIRALQESLAGAVNRTPVTRCAGLEEIVGGDTTIFAKLEFLQRTGTFKARGALAVLAQLDPDQIERGITAVSAGNHAIAAAYAARSVGASAKIVMIGSANPYRIAACEAVGGEVILVDDVHEAFAVAENIQEEEGRYFVHPFEGADIATGTGTLGLEIHEQCPDFDSIVVTIGGGGLIGGVSNALKQLRPDCHIIGVEPDGADSMHRSMTAGEPKDIPNVETIADSLGAPFALPYSFGLCQKNVDQLCRVSDKEIRRAMGLLFSTLKVAVEPACAASSAALVGPLREQLRGQRVMLLFCGSNIDWQTFADTAIFQDEDAT
ncbi:MAG: threonine ammonia-lyase [Woeseiaceae bacterium]